jgi:ribosomal-protein-serine acetyltransferase
MNPTKPAKHKVADQFETERLMIRRYQKTDTKALYAAARESIVEVSQFLPWCHADYSIAESEQWVTLVMKNWGENNQFCFVVEEKFSRKFIGGVGLNAVDQHPMVNLGYWLRSSETGKGYATEAAQGLIDWAFAELQIQRIEIILSVENLPSKKVAEKTNARHEGILSSRLLIHGRLHDAHLFALTRSGHVDAHSTDISTK